MLKLFFTWSLCASAPFYSTADVEWLYVKYGIDSAAGWGFANENILNGGMTNSRPVNHTVKLFSPKGVDAVWASWMERKWYVAEIVFSDEERRKIKDALRSTYPSCNTDDIENLEPKKGIYDIFHVCLFPGGTLRYFLESSDYDRIISLDIVSQGRETHELDEDFLYGRRGMIRRADEKYWENVDDFFDEMTHDGKYKKELDAIEEEYGEETRKRIEYYRGHGALDPAFWDPYFFRYNYNISVILEDPTSQLRMESCFFTNAEMYERYPAVNPDNVITRPSALRNLVFEWESEGFIYSCHIYFNEEETFRIFREFLGDDMDKRGELKVFVSRSNNNVEVSLSAGENTCAFEKMQVDIGRRERNYDNVARIYKNYEGEHQDFVGR